MLRKNERIERFTILDICDILEMLRELRVFLFAAKVPLFMSTSDSLSKNRQSIDNGIFVMENDMTNHIPEILSNFTITGQGCWNYNGYKNDCGYGRLRYKGKKVLVHRLAYQHYVGDIPSTKIICHICDNPACINPEHLYAGTQKDNAQDMTNRNRQWLQRAKEQGLYFDIRNGRIPDEYKKIR